MSNLISNFSIGDKIIFKDNSIINIINLAGTVPCLTSNGVAEMQLYIVLYNNEEYYASNTGLKQGNPDIFKRVVANIGYRGAASYRGFEKEYTIWKNILYRCYWDNSNIYKYYGAKGITVDPKWHCFELFLYDLVNMRTYDTFKEAKRLYDIDLSRQKKLPCSERCYAPGKVLLRPLSLTDISEALDNAKSEGVGTTSGTYINTSQQPRNIHPVQIVNYVPLANGSYSYKAYEQMLNNPPNLPIPGNDDVGYNNIRVVNGIHKSNATLIKPTTTAVGSKREMCRIVNKK